MELLRLHFYHSANCRGETLPRTHIFTALSLVFSIGNGNLFLFDDAVFQQGKMHTAPGQIKDVS